MTNLSETVFFFEHFNNILNTLVAFQVLSRLHKHERLQLINNYSHSTYEVRERIEKPAECVLLFYVLRW